MEDQSAGHVDYGTRGDERAVRDGTGAHAHLTSYHLVDVHSYGAA